MSVQTVDQTWVKNVDLSEASPPRKFFAVLTQFYARLQHAHRVERLAKQLYAMSDADLATIGITREQIPAHLAQAFQH